MNRSWRPSRLGHGVAPALALICWLGGAEYQAQTAGSSSPPILLCGLTMERSQVAVDEYALAAEIAVTERETAAEIFALVDELWEAQAVDRRLYLTAKRDRDVTAIQVKRRQLQLERAKAARDQYAAVCSSARTTPDRQQLERALARYRQLDCHRIGKDLAIAEVELDYAREILASVRELRVEDVATRQDVIRAERDLEQQEIRVRRQRARVEACKASGAAAGRTGAGGTAGSAAPTKPAGVEG